MEGPQSCDSTDLGYKVLPYVKNVEGVRRQVFGDVVVRSCIQTLHPVFDTTTLRQNQHR